MASIEIWDTFPMEKWDMMDAFLSAAYSPHYVLRDKNLFRWLFCTSDKDTANIFCAADGDTLVGIMAYTPTDFFWGDLAVRRHGAWTANWMVLPQYQGNVGWLLMRRLQRKADIVIGHNAGNDNLKLAPILGFKVYNPMAKFVGVFDPVRTASMLDAIHSDWAEATLNGFLTDMPGKTNPTVSHKVDELSRTDYDPEWSLYPDMRYGTIRDLAYLNRRYIAMPSFEYHLFIAGPATSPAVCVCRIEETYGAATLKVGRILEFFHPRDAADRIAPLQEALRFMKEQGCAFCDFFCTSATFGTSVLEAGLHREESLLLPHRLSPVEAPRQETMQNLELCVRIAPAAPPMEEMYVTKSDGDQDRPNYRFEK